MAQQFVPRSAAEPPAFGGTTKLPDGALNFKRRLSKHRKVTAVVDDVASWPVSAYLKSTAITIDTASDTMSA